MLSDVKTLSHDLAPLIFDPKAGFSLLLITAVDAKVIPPDIESGTVHARVVEPLRPDTPPAGATVSFAFSRDADEDARARRGDNAWNTLRLEKNARLLVAWIAVDAPRGEYSLLGAASQPDADMPDVTEVKQALAIQALPPNSPQRRERLGEALVTGRNILRRYACAAVGPRQLVSRDEGVGMLRAAIGSPNTGPDDDLALADTLMDPPLFDPDKGDDAANEVVLTTLADSFVRSDLQHEGMWFRFLYSRVMATLSEDPDEDAMRRRDLLRAIGVETDAMAVRLQQHAAQAKPDAAAATEMLDAWRAARR